MYKKEIAEFRRNGKVFIADNQKANAFEATVSNEGMHFRKEKVYGGIWYHHEEKLSDHATEIAPGVQQVDVMSLFGALRRF